MTESRVYADSTALIGLARIGRLDFLTVLPGQVVTTRHVWLEITGSPEKPGAQALIEAQQRGLLEVVDEGDPTDFPELEPGEASVLSAAVSAQAPVLMDEHKARALIATSPELRQLIPDMTGVLGVILLAKDEGRISAVRPFLDALIRENFRISRRLYDEVLVEAGER